MPKRVVDPALSVSRHVLTGALPGIIRTRGEKTVLSKLSMEIVGLASSSPLGQSITTRVDGLADLVFDEAPQTAPFYWHRAVANTALQWFGETHARRSAPASRGSLVIDLHGRNVRAGARTWRIVDKHGIGLLSPMTALVRCCSEDYTASLFLIESTDQGKTWYQLCDAHISAAAGYRTLLQGLGRTAVELLAAGARRGAGSRFRSRWVPAKRSADRIVRMQLANAAARWWNRLTDETWAIAVLDQPPERLLASQKVVATQWLRPPRPNSFIADPFSWDGRPDVILCELFSFGTRRGTLEALEISDGRITRTRPVTPDSNCHFSYPFNWMENGRTYCMPEMGESRRQVLYELVPDGPLRPVCVLAEDVPMADPTLFRADGLYWLAYTNSDIGPYNNLCLRFAEKLEGPWREHPLNPVKIDIRSARPGGTPFRVGEALFRPAQNCARSYGVALAVNRVELCTPSRYEEETVAMLSPDPDGPFPDGLHTLSIQNDMVLIDGKRLALGSVPRKVRTKVSKLLGRHRAVSGAIH